MTKAVISVALPLELYQALQAEADDRLTSKSAIVRQVLQDHVRGLKRSAELNGQSSNPNPEQEAA